MESMTTREISTFLINNKDLLKLSDFKIRIIIELPKNKRNYVVKEWRRIRKEIKLEELRK